MEFDELTDLWKAYDQELDQQPALELSLLKQASLKKAKSQLWENRLESWLEVMLNAFFAQMVLQFAWNHLDQWAFLLPAIYLLAHSALDIGYHLYRLIKIRRLDYGQSIRDAQIRLHQLMVAEQRYHRWLWLLIPTFLLPLAIVAAKGLLGLSLYAFPVVIWGTLAVGIMGVPIVYLVIWLARDRKLKEAKAFLQEIAQFSEEEETDH